MTRANVESAQTKHNQGISAESSGVLGHGAALKQEVHAEQDKGVIRRVGGKGVKEIENIGSDVLKATFGERQQK